MNTKKLWACDKADLNWKPLLNCPWNISLAIFGDEVFIRMEQEECGAIRTSFNPLKVSLIAAFAGMPTLNQICLFTSYEHEPQIMPLYVKPNSFNYVVADVNFSDGFSFGINFSKDRLQKLIELEKEVVHGSQYSTD